MRKQYIDVECRIDRDGIICPVKVFWDDGRSWDVKKVLHTCTASHNDLKNSLYIKDRRAEKYLYRDGQRWYVDHSP